MKRFNGKDPINARINIDYKPKSPRVKFVFPDKRKQFKGSMGETILMGICLLFMLFYWIPFGILGSDSGLENYDSSELKKFSQCVAKHPIKTMLNYSTVRYKLCKPKSEVSFVNWIGIFLPFIIIIGSWALIYFPFKKKWDSLFPEYQALTARKKYRKFKPKDIQIDKEGKYYVEVPVFNNIVCDYNAKEDFSKYLEFFEIREHPFYSYKLKRFKKDKKKSRKINEWLWYARWYFKEKPKKGYMEVIFK